jgi:hypothetical protein
MNTPDRADRPLTELLLESGEFIVDQLIENPIAKEIPVVGTALKVCKAVDDIRNRMFLAKLIKFINAIEQADESVREKWRAKCTDSADDLNKIGESVLLVIERSNDLRKPEIIGILFLAFIDDVITSTELARLTQAVDVCFVDDLQMLLDSHNPPQRSREAWMQYLTVACLTELAPLVFDDDATSKFNTSSLGNKLINAYRHGRKKMAEPSST